jgi:hypothetical protein
MGKRKFADNIIVLAHYSTRSNTLRFFGRIVGFKNKRYEVLFLTPDSSSNGYYYNRNTRRLKHDMILSCHGYELSSLHEHCLDWNKSIDDTISLIKQSAQKSFATWCKENLMGDWYITPEIHKQTIIYKSFQAKRVQDWALNRVFPIVTFPSRTEYLYV